MLGFSSVNELVLVYHHVLVIIWSMELSDVDPELESIPNADCKNAFLNCLFYQYSESDRMETQTNPLYVKHKHTLVSKTSVDM